MKVTIDRAKWVTGAWENDSALYSPAVENEYDDEPELRLEEDE